MQSISNILDKILEKAVLEKASDIHLEPQEEHLLIRFRIDGVLRGIETLNKTAASQLISRIKILVNLDIAEKRLPQDGRTFISINSQKLDLRISTLPTIHGEKTVIRILNRQDLLLSIEELGMEKEDLSAYLSLISRKNGIILVVGPTGSGKTTTLYATLSRLNTREVNITTIEDPIEYQLHGINQIQVNPKTGLTFPKGLRAILRQDPDIIMIGEIRDKESAQISIQAALTGHLVLSTLHTNDAISSITRLLDMGIEPFLISSTLIGCISQRLLRKKCLPCELCDHTGYRGRIAIFEILKIDEQLRVLIEEKATKEKIIQWTAKNHKNSLFEAGARKVKDKITDEAELNRVLYAEN